MPSRQSMCKCYYFSPLCLLSIKTSSIWHMQTTRGHMCISLSTDKDLIILLFSFPFLEKIYSFLQSVCSINAICGPGTTLMPKVRIESNFSVSSQHTYHKHLLMEKKITKGKGQLILFF